MNLNKYSSLNKKRNEFIKFSKSFPQKHIFGTMNENSTGDNIHGCKNCENCFDLSNSENCKNILVSAQNMNFCHDANYAPNSDFLYESMSACNSKKSLSLLYSWDVANSHYCEDCFYSNNLFGCIGLKNKQYCIFNKQYSKEEYFELKNKIIEHMKSSGEWGEFFPIALSSFSYNETIANDYYPLSKEQIIKKGYSWKDEEQGTKYTGPQIKIPDSIDSIDESILKEILECIDCSKNYRIVGPELKFYKKMNLPIPRKCPNCRHTDRMVLRNPRKLFDRKCDKCAINLQSTYSPDREEKIYCEECYKKEII